MPSTVHRLESIAIVVGDDHGQAFAVHIDPARGISSTSGELLAVRGSGERIHIDALAFLEAIFEEGVRHGQRGQKK